ncbi:hypothetical protein CGRA01v4_09361 [Colletotrichum graminicola]|nr:hypothetical protein CGRA01v4_09361 [Colletotrichum graminicola]
MLPVTARRRYRDTRDGEAVLTGLMACIGLALSSAICASRRQRGVTDLPTSCLGCLKEARCISSIKQ